MECFIGKIVKLLTNYGCNSGLGLHLQTSMELLVIEAGVSTQILAQAYQPYSIWVTHWLKSVWEKIDLFNLTLKIKPLPLQFPWTNDDWLMLIFVKTGYSNGDLVRLNRVRCHQQVLFYSDIFDARGRLINRRYRTKRAQRESWSTLIFPVERPPSRDFCLWLEVLEDIALHGIPRRRLGKRIEAGHKV